ncbi:hypothetical protein AMTRI_Chr13g121000 [Amborella trichopoda]
MSWQFFPQRVLLQFRHTQNYISLERRSFVALSFRFNDTLPRFLLREVCHGRGRSPLPVRGWSSKTSPQLPPSMILGGNMLVLFHYAPDLRDFVVNLLLLLRISCLLEKMAPLVKINESNPMRTCLTLAWKRAKSNWLDGWPSWRNSRRRMLIRNQSLNRKYFLFLYFLFLA